MESFISESVYDLRSRLLDVGSDLTIRFGRPEDVVDNLVKAFQAQGDTVEGVWMQNEMTSHEIQVERNIAERLKPLGVPLSLVYGKTLIHPADLPFDISDTPDVFTPFRKNVEALGPAMVRPCFTSPSKFKPYPDIPKTEDYVLDVSYEVDVDGLSSRAPESQDKTEKQVSFHDILRYLLKPLNDPALSYSSEGTFILQQRHPASAFPLRGGESSALERLEWYFVRGKSHDSARWGKMDPPPVARYKQTRNNLLGHTYSTKMSPFLAYGSVSPRQIWEALNYHEEKFGEDQNTYWVRFELLWRDYFFFAAEKFGDLLFHVGGFELATDPKEAEKKLEKGWWKSWSSQDGPDHPITRLLQGRTGIPFLDANMIELRDSGFMSNRGRQNVASFMSKNLGYNWKIGAEFFQSHLIDYDPTSNYGNWQYVAGVGNDPRASRQFNCIKQAKDYDSHGEYVKTWLPALRNLHPDYVHTPWLLDAEERRSYGLKTTQMDVTIDSYPERPIIEDESWQKHYNRKEGVGSKMYGNPQEKVKDGKVKRYKKLATNVARPGRFGDNSQAHNMERTLSNTLAPNFLPSTKQRNGRANPTIVDANQSNEGSFESWSASRTSSTSKTGNTTISIPPLRAVRSGVTSGIHRSGSPASSALSSTSGTTTPTMSGSSGWPALGSGRTSSQRGIIGGALGSLGNPVPAVDGAMAASKADTESSWRRTSQASKNPPNLSSASGSSS